MKISIITVCLNAEKYIEEAIKSVLNQTYDDLEYIVIDGGSEDSTLEIIEKYKESIDIFISEKDNGIFDAMNKGIKAASGDIIAILNSDDYYCCDTVLSDVVSEFKKYSIDSLYGNIVIVNPENGKVKRFWKNKKIFSADDFKFGWHPPHPAFFVKRDVYEECGNFNLKYKIASDYELMLRFLVKCKIKSKMFDKRYPFVIMRAGGESNKSLKNIIKSNKEVIKAWKDNNLKMPKGLVAYKLFYKIKQFFYGLEE